MIKIKDQDLKKIAPLVDKIEDSMVISYLQGYMGEGYVINKENPKAAMIVSGEYSFFGGDAESDEAKELVKNLFQVNPSDVTVGIFADDEPGWEKTLMAQRANNPVKIPRFGIVQKDYDFDENLLQRYIDKIQPEFSLVPFDEELYHQAMAQDWAKEFCETFSSCEDYLKRGFGFAITKNGKLLAGASTMTVYDGGMEVQVATHSDYQGKGFAVACAAALIKECVKREIRPCWDAANLASKNMALKLGYEYKGMYTTIKMQTRREGNQEG